MNNVSPNYKKFIISYLLATIADVLYIVVSTTFIYFLTESLTLASLPVVLAMISFSIGSILTNKIVLLYPNIKSLYLISRVVILILMIFFLFNLMLFSSSLVLYYILVFLIPIFRGINVSLDFPIIPLIERNEVKGNSILAITRNTVNLIGWGIGGALVSWIGGSNVVVIIIGLILLSIIPFMLINGTALNIENETSNVIKKSKQIINIFKPFVNIFSNKTVKIVFISEFFFLLGGGIWTSSILLAYVIEILGKSETWWGYLLSLYMFGAIIGGILVLKVNKLVKNYLLLSILLSGFMYCVVTLTFAFNNFFWLAGMIFMIFGIPENLKEVAQASIIQKAGVGSTNKRVELFSLYNVMDSLVHGLSIVLLSNIADLFGVQNAFLLALVFNSVATLIVLKHFLKNKQNVGFF